LNRNHERNDKYDIIKPTNKGGKKVKQGTFTDIEYSGRKKKTRREEFLEIMDEIISWDELETVY
jgi:hypothetical protein